MAIESGKIVLKDIFSNFWFTIPSYQRPYAWTDDNVNDLLEDLWFAHTNDPNNEYFVGSLVLKRTQANFREFEVLDGQQRLTTFALLFVVIREKTNDNGLKNSLNQKLYQEESRYDNIPGRSRIIYQIRGDANEFISRIVNSQELFNSNDISVRNMNAAIRTARKFFEEKAMENGMIEEFARFLFQKVVFIYVATQNREDAFRLFSILNNRGIPLTNADILKAMNIGEIEENNGNVEEYAKKWETIQNELNEDFDRFLGFIRTILLKRKARKNLLEEFESEIYANNILSKGEETIDFLEKYYGIYTKIIDFPPNETIINDGNGNGDNEYKNLITIMKTALPSTDWIPPLLRYYEKFENDSLLEFLKKLEFKFSSDWIMYFTPTQRIENMNKILLRIEDAESSEDVLNDKDIFNVKVETLREILKGNVYGKRFAKYILLKYEFLMQDNAAFIGNYRLISVEHVLPQNPSQNSQWSEWFSNQEIENYKHKLGNLVLLNRRTNAALSNLNFEDKKNRYFDRGRIATFPSINYIMQKSEWKANDIEKRTIDMISKLTLYKVQ